MINNLYDLLVEAKKDNQDAMMEIIRVFMPLIKKYSRKLLYDGAESDIIILLLKLIKDYPISNKEKNTQDKDIIAYINISVKHEYIRLSKKFSNIIKMEME